MVYKYYPPIEIQCPYCGCEFWLENSDRAKLHDERQVEVECPAEHYLRVRVFYNDSDLIEVEVSE